MTEIEQAAALLRERGWTVVEPAPAVQVGQVWASAIADHQKRRVIARILDHSPVREPDVVFHHEGNPLMAFRRSLSDFNEWVMQNAARPVEAP